MPYTAMLRWSCAAALGAGVAWLLVWAHQARAHGTTQLNEMELVLGLTWMDSGSSSSCRSCSPSCCWAPPGRRGAGTASRGASRGSRSRGRPQRSPC